MGNILEIKDLSKNFKGLKAVDSVSFAVGRAALPGSSVPTEPERQRYSI